MAKEFVNDFVHQNGIDVITHNPPKGDSGSMPASCWGRRIIDVFYTNFNAKIHTGDKSRGFHKQMESNKKTKLKGLILCDYIHIYVKLKFDPKIITEKKFEGRGTYLPAPISVGAHYIFKRTLELPSSSIAAFHDPSFN
ncbi:hypothetical protein JHK82_040444 [Glycine max]|nr:hypothetical protein JHK82_040444 [Glycine max]